MENTKKEFEYPEATKKAVGSFAKWFFAILAAFTLAIGIVNAFVPSSDVQLKAALDAHKNIAIAFNNSKKAMCDSEVVISLRTLEIEKDKLTTPQKQCFAQKAAWTCPNDFDETLNCSNL